MHHALHHAKDHHTDPQDMRNMGGLLGRMPWTGWTFILGALALAGFPFLTAGFWSKDEILASAYHEGGHIWVFITLAITAFLTAFYTMRQVGMTFFGQPRTSGAEHAPESAWSMVIPLALITPFALGLGWLGIPRDFPVVGGAWLNVVEETLEPYVDYLQIHPVHPTFNWVPLAVSLVVVLGGIGFGWLIYGRGLATGQIDPLRNWLGPIWILFHRKYYVDELYSYTFIPFVRGFSKFLYWVDDVWIIDPIVDAIGRLGIWIGKVSALIDTYVVDGTVGALAWISDRSGRVLRNSQDGHIQVYLVIAVVSVTVWLLLKALPVLLTLV
jgi:NADH-quinone oxidoreductase subunit L